MKATGIVRQLDKLGRIVLPKELRKVFNIENEDYLEIYKDENSRLDDYLSFWFNSDEDPDKAASITVHHETLQNS